MLHIITIIWLISMIVSQFTIAWRIISLNTLQFNGMSLWPWNNSTFLLTLFAYFDCRQSFLYQKLLHLIQKYVPSDKWLEPIFVTCSPVSSAQIMTLYCSKPCLLHIYTNIYCMSLHEPCNFCICCGNQLCTIQPILI